MGSFEQVSCNEWCFQFSTSKEKDYEIRIGMERLDQHSVGRSYHEIPTACVATIRLDLAMVDLCDLVHTHKKSKVFTYVALMAFTSSLITNLLSFPLQPIFLCLPPDFLPSHHLSPLLPHLHIYLRNCQPFTLHQ